MRAAFTPKPGGTIPSNGAVIVAAKQVGTLGDWIVLAIANPDAPRAEYVTWHVDTGGLAYTGNYFRTDLTAAVNDYDQRR